ncbi:hypothetical protein IW262DRAFT_1506813 [Armillaria fumosa]|nr:hypothetical protein IW262DRAFT_1506813 [Armillaria fumosa]
MAHYTLFHGDLAPAHNNGSLTPPATRTSNATTSLPSYAAVLADETPLLYSSMLIALPIWDGLAREEQLFYETLARREREFCGRDHATPALQRRVSARDSGSRNIRGRQMVLSRSVLSRDLPHLPVAQVDPQALVNRVPIMTPTAAPEILGIQYFNSSTMNVNTDPVAHNVHTIEEQPMIDLRHGQATPTSPRWPVSISIPPAVTETSISDSQIHDSVPYYHDTSGQSFLITNQPTTPQYLPSAPIVAPIAYRPNPVATSFTYHQLDENTYDQGWGEPSTTYTSASSSLEVGTSNYGGRCTQGERSSAYYGHPAESTWDGFQDHQHQPWSSGYSGQSS